MKFSISQFDLILVFCLITYGSLLSAQPSATPATNFQWIKTGTASYTTGEISTIPESPSDSSYGASGDSDPASCASYCGSACDGEPYIQAIVFGTTPGFNTSSCEQRVVNLTEWNNANPDSGVSNGATTGTVYLPTSATITIIQSPSAGAAGTGAGGDENRAWIIGGNSGGNSVFTVNVNYSIDWHIPSYSLSSGSNNQNYNFTWNWGEPGNGQEVEISGWNNYSTDGFGQSFADAFALSVNNISQSGGPLEVTFAANSEISIFRNSGNADGKVQHGPGMEGRAKYEVTYDIWEIEAVLPLTLVDFSGQVVADNVELNWATVSEINSDYFILQSSINGLEWKSIAKIQCEGWSNSRVDYQYLDKNTKSSSYYRLQQVDFDGSMEYSKVIFIRSVVENIVETTVYPNPSHGIIYCNNTDNAIIDIIDMIGEKKMSVKNGSVDLSELNQGLYYVRYQYNDGSTSLTKILKL